MDLIVLEIKYGYLLHQFFHLSNKEEDEYGGNYLNRSRILLEIGKKSRSMAKEKILGARITGLDHLRWN